MPYPMTHLVIAQRMLGEMEIADISAFYLGSISPDAYRHFSHDKNDHARAAAHFDCADGPLGAALLLGAPDGERDFRKGYLLHLLVDRYWDGAVVRPVLRAASEQEIPYRIYAHDMGVLDVELYCRTDAALTILPPLAAAEPMGLSPYILPQQAAMERDITLSWYEKHLAMRHEKIAGCIPLSALIEHVDFAARHAREGMRAILLSQA